MNPDVIGYIAATLTTLCFAPQAIKTLKTRDTESLSLAMYSMFTVGVLLWFVYGVMRGDWVIITANIFTELLAVPILVLKVLEVARKRKKIE